MANTTKRDLTIAECYLNGESLRTIAPKVGLSYPRVSQILNSEQVKVLVQSAISGYLAEAPKIQERFLGLCFHEDPKISLDAIKEWHKVTGFAPSHTSSMVLQQIYVDQRPTEGSGAGSMGKRFVNWYLDQPDTEATEPIDPDTTIDV